MIPNPLDPLFPVIANAVSEWQAENTPAKIARDVKKRLTASSEEITLKLLGFNNRYGSNWELDHCNGRTGSSAAGDYLRSTQQDAIQDWFATNLMPSLSPTVQKQLKREMNDEYQSIFRAAVRKATKEAAENDARTLISKLSADNHTSNYQKLMELIDPTPQPTK